ncbi:MAG: DUF3800 domain-containing protein [Eubacteriales bacterium]
MKYLHRRLYETMYAAYPKLSIAEDSFGTSEFQAGYHKYVEVNRPKRNLLNEYDFTFVDSKSRLIQLADFIAGSICQQMEDVSGNDYFQILRGKNNLQHAFPSNRRGPYFSSLI